LLQLLIKSSNKNHRLDHCCEEVMLPEVLEVGGIVRKPLNWLKRLLGRITFRSLRRWQHTRQRGRNRRRRRIGITPRVSRDSRTSQRLAGRLPIMIGKLFQLAKKFKVRVCWVHV